MYEFPGEGRKAGVHMPPWNPLEGRPCIYIYRILGVLTRPSNLPALQFKPAPRAQE